MTHHQPLTWARTGHFVGSWKGDKGYWGSRQILRKLQKRNSKRLADILVVEENGWESQKVQRYRAENKIIIPANEVYEYLTVHHPEYLL